jgi:hypothetical protein
MPFRIAIGDCSCDEPLRHDLDRQVCAFLRESIGRWRARLPQELSAFPRESHEELGIDERPAIFGLYRQELDSERVLLVFQVFVHTWRRPTFISAEGVGRMYAEGLIVESDGTIAAAPRELMWQFR